jgi:GTP cyclohydrolase I
MSYFGSKGDVTHGGKVDVDRAQLAVSQLLSAFGLSTEEEHLRDTPRRIVEMYSELWRGLFMDPPKLTTFEVGTRSAEMVLLKDISFVSTCSHHLLPFQGLAHVAYVPGSRLVGLSKLARIVDYYAARPQVQEELTRQIANGLSSFLKPTGVAVVLEAAHGCLTCRGAMKSGSKMVTTIMEGCFANHERHFRDDFLRALERR